MLLNLLLVAVLPIFSLPVETKHGENYNLLSHILVALPKDVIDSISPHYLILTEQERFNKLQLYCNTILNEHSTLRISEPNFDIIRNDRKCRGALKSMQHYFEKIVLQKGDILALSDVLSPTLNQIIVWDLSHHLFTNTFFNQLESVPYSNAKYILDIASSDAFQCKDYSIKLTHQIVTRRIQWIDLTNADMNNDIFKSFLLDLLSMNVSIIGFLHDQRIITNLDLDMNYFQRISFVKGVTTDSCGKTLYCFNLEFFRLMKILAKDVCDQTFVLQLDFKSSVP